MHAKTSLFQSISAVPTRFKCRQNAPFIVLVFQEATLILGLVHSEDPLPHAPPPNTKS